MQLRRPLCLHECLKAFGSPSEALTAVLTDHSWSVPAYDTHRLFARHVPTYAYEFAERDHTVVPRRA